MFVKRIFAIIVVIFIIMACVPVSAIAVDPVSTATMGNALAQAITAYGASHGVSMTYDVASTNGIGEGMHELWKDFKEYINDNNVPTYDSLANTMWANIYTKIGNYVGININDTEISYIDAFWNWLLSGPGEMEKVDNEYYEWELTQDNTVVPINVYNQANINGYSIAILPVTCLYNGNTWNYRGNLIYAFVGHKTSTYGYELFLISESYPVSAELFFNGSYDRTINLNMTDDSINYATGLSVPYSSNVQSIYNNIPVLENIDGDSSKNNKPSGYLGSLSGNNTTLIGNSNIALRPYIGDIFPQDIYIPDNEDVNYAPLPYVGGIDIPWDDSLFGNGTGTLTDAQSEAISGVIDNTIIDSLEKTLTLADTDNPDLPAPNEVYIPFLPVSLPSFNFSLSGIWHYVREWLSSLGAWFTMVLTIWGNLPYAIVVPVYATMVILIVLGVYKRFFM